MQKLIVALTLISLASITSTAQGACQEKKLTFAANFMRPVPAAGSNIIWGGNATDGEHVLSPPYTEDFLSRARTAKSRGLEVFAYLEGPCGNTDGEDDGEIARCASLHNDFNRRFSPQTPNTPLARWKPYTMAQLKSSGTFGIDHCEIDNLTNNVTIPLIPLLREIKGLYDRGAIHCRLVLKNVSISELNQVKEEIAPRPADADFISPFHIFEDDSGTGQQAGLSAAMRRLKGNGAVTIISTVSSKYGEYFTDSRFVSCTRDR